MTYHLYLGDRTYSSWSLRGWLMLHRFGLPVETTLVDFLSGTVADQMKDLAPARTVPALRTPEGAVVWDSLAIGEELASRHPEVGLWPADPAARATARSLAAEMHSGFSALRNECPMNLRVTYSDVPVSDAVASELWRLQQIWAFARDRFGGDGPWLFGDYTITDAFFAPIAARIAGYGLPVDAAAQAYVTTHLADPAFRRWRAMAMVRGSELPWYSKDYPRRPWPGPAPLPARAVDAGEPENAACPFSGLAVTDLAEVDGRVLGFCNPFCRDKTVADPLSWPQVAELLEG